MGVAGMSLAGVGLVGVVGLGVAGVAGVGLIGLALDCFGESGRLGISTLMSTVSMGRRVLIAR